MRRITVSLDDSLVELAEADVAAGRSTSVSAWVAAAMRAKAQARADLVADLERIEQTDPTSPAVIASLARTAGLPKGVVSKAIRRSRARAPARNAG